jgi:hypothetical protein
MEPKGYELLKIEARINVLEKELTILFEDYKKYENNKNIKSENITYKKLQILNISCLKLLDVYREYVTMQKIKN